MTKAKTTPPPATGGKSTTYYVCSLIGIILVFGFGHLTPFGPLTPLGMKVLGIFLGMIFLWSFVSILWPSLVGIAALGLSGYAPMNKVLSMAFGDSVPILILFTMVLFGAIQHSGVTRYVSRWFLTRKIINGKPVVFSFIFIYTAYVLAAATSVLPALMFMWAILYSVLNDVGYKKGDAYTAIMVIGTMFGAISGQASKPFVGSALMMVGSYEKVAQTTMDYLPYMLFGFIMSSLGIILYALMLKFIFRPDMSKIQNISAERFRQDELPPMSLQQKIMFSTLFGYLILVLLPSILPKTWPVISILSKLGPCGVVIAFIAVLSLVKIDDQPILNFKEVASKHLVWDVYFLICMAMAISSALTQEGTGITQFMKESLYPLLGGHSPFMLAVMVVVFSITVTQFANNGVMGVIMMPIIHTFCQESGGSFVAIATVTIFALHLAILTPAASPYAAIIYGNKDWLNQKEIIKYGGSIFILGILLYTLIGIPLSEIICS